MTSADMVAGFLRLHVGRKALGEQHGAAIEGQLLKAMKPALMQMAELDQFEANDPRAIAFEQMFGKIQQTVATPHANYNAFRKALKPLMVTARKATGPQVGGRPGERLFAPPHLYHLMATGFGKGEGMLEMEYAFNQVHWSQTEQASNR
ncbi:MAG: hypothetical protein JRH20_22210 [Deltaproteobacteria bacterium]|nr:hypothetical protein [Deltaproteobacteria bacterium]